MAAVRTEASVSTVSARQLRQRLGWCIVALLTGWMAATCLVYLGVVLGAVPPHDSSLALAAVSIAGAFALYVRFVRIQRVDEVPVLLVVIGWTVALGLISL